MEWTADRLEQELGKIEGVIGRMRSVQAQLVDEAHRRRLPFGDGSKNLTEWVAARLDVSMTTARDLVRLSKSDDLADLEDGDTSTDRAVARRRLADAGASKEAIERSDGYDIAGVRRLTSAHRGMTDHDERSARRSRRLEFRTNADGSMTKIWGELPGVDGKIVEETLRRLGDELPDPPDGRRPVAQRTADALVRLCLGDDDTVSPASALVLADARLAAPTDGAAGVTVLSGPRVGAQALEAILCEGTVEVVALAADGTPLGVGTTSAAVPPKLRRYVLARDGACTADGCGSTYRLQAHHIVEASNHGPTEAANLTTLCWYHHHVVVHGRGFRIDPESPPGRLRFLAPVGDRAPPN